MSEKQPQQEIYIDVDDTLATGVVYRHMRLYNRILKLGMTKEEIKAAGTQYKKTFDVPQIVSFRQQNEERFKQVRNALRLSKALHRTFDSIPRSQFGVLALSLEFKNQGYYTVRPKEMNEPTKQWLHNRDFKNPNDVVICLDHKDKIQKILASGQKNNHKVLIDDSLPGLISAVEEIHKNSFEGSDQLSNLTLVGYGYSQEKIDEMYPNFSDTTGVRLLPLPNWEPENTQTLIESVNKLNTN